MNGWIQILHAHKAAATDEDTLSIMIGIIRS